MIKGSRFFTFRRWATWPGVFLATAVLVAGCQEKEVLLPGERFELRGLEEASEQRAAPATEGAIGQETFGAAPEPLVEIPIPAFTVTGTPQRISLPGQRANADWTHTNGSATHQITHPALGGTLTRVWSVSIGQGNSRKLRISTDPVVAGGRVFTMDTVSSIKAHSTNGQLLWSRNLTPASERAGEASGGGLAVSGNRLYVTTGYGSLHSLDVVSGGTFWEQKLGSIPAGAPTVDRDRVYLSTRDGRAWAIATDNGRIVWELSGSEATSAWLHGAGPAVGSKSAIFPFGSGEIQSVLKRGGVQLWATTIAGARRGRAYAGVSDVTSDPVIVGSTVYAGSPSGRLAAIDVTSGERKWTATEGALSPVWPAGGSLFLVSDQNQLLRLNASNGTPIWAATLPLFRDVKVKRHKAVFSHYGPILAGGRLILASNDGLLRQVDPSSGQLIAATELPGPAAANPVVAGRTLYIVTGDGQLHAYR